MSVVSRACAIISRTLKDVDAHVSPLVTFTTLFRDLRPHWPSVADYAPSLDNKLSIDDQLKSINQFLRTFNGRLHADAFDVLAQCMRTNRSWSDRMVTDLGASVVFGAYVQEVLAEPLQVSWMHTGRQSVYYNSPLRESIRAAMDNARGVSPGARSSTRNNPTRRSEMFMLLEALRDVDSPRDASNSAAKHGTSLTSVFDEEQHRSIEGVRCRRRHMGETRTSLQFPRPAPHAPIQLSTRELEVLPLAENLLEVIMKSDAMREEALAYAKLVDPSITHRITPYVISNRDLAVYWDVRYCSRLSHVILDWLRHHPVPGATVASATSSSSSMAVDPTDDPLVRARSILAAFASELPSSEDQPGADPRRFAEHALKSPVDQTLIAFIRVTRLDLHHTSSEISRGQRLMYSGDVEVPKTMQNKPPLVAVMWNDTLARCDVFSDRGATDVLRYVSSDVGSAVTSATRYHYSLSTTMTSPPSVGTHATYKGVSWPVPLVMYGIRILRIVCESLDTSLWRLADLRLDNKQTVIGVENRLDLTRKLPQTALFSTHSRGYAVKHDWVAVFNGEYKREMLRRVDVNTDGMKLSEIEAKCLRTADDQRKCLDVARLHTVAAMKTQLACAESLKAVLTTAYKSKWPKSQIDLHHKGRVNVFLSFLQMRSHHNHPVQSLANWFRHTDPKSPYSTRSVHEFSKKTNRFVDAASDRVISAVRDVRLAYASGYCAAAMAVSLYVYCRARVGMLIDQKQESSRDAGLLVTAITEINEYVNTRAGAMTIHVSTHPRYQRMWNFIGHTDVVRRGRLLTTAAGIPTGDTKATTTTDTKIDKSHEPVLGAAGLLSNSMELCHHSVLLGCPLNTLLCYVTMFVARFQYDNVLKCILKLCLAGAQTSRGSVTTSIAMSALDKTDMDKELITLKQHIRTALSIANSSLGDAVVGARQKSGLKDNAVSVDVFTTVFSKIRRKARSRIQPTSATGTYDTITDTRLSDQTLLEQDRLRTCVPLASASSSAKTTSTSTLTAMDVSEGPAKSSVDNSAHPDHYTYAYAINDIVVACVEAVVRIAREQALACSETREADISSDAIETMRVVLLELNTKLTESGGFIDTVANDMLLHCGMSSVTDTKSMETSGQLSDTVRKIVREAETDSKVVSVINQLHEDVMGEQFTGYLKRASQHGPLFSSWLEELVFVCTKAFWIHDYVQPAHTFYASWSSSRSLVAQLQSRRATCLEFLTHKPMVFGP